MLFNRGETYLNDNGSHVPIKAQFSASIVDSGTNDYTYITILREYLTGYTRFMRHSENKKDMSLLYINPSKGTDEIRKWGHSFFLVPDVGIVSSLDDRGFLVSMCKTISIEDAEKQSIALIKAGRVNELQAHEKEVLLPSPDLLGKDFYYIPEHAEPPPPPNMLSVVYKSNILSFKLESVTAITNRFAVIEFNSDFKVRKATRFN